MKLAVWLDGVVYKVRLSEELYRLYREGKGEVPSGSNLQPHEDVDAIKRYERDMAILSPFSRDDTLELLQRVGLSPSIIVNNEGKTKPSLEPYKRLFEESGWDPLEVVTIGASPLDLLSSRYYDSRVKVICVNRGEPCEKYSPTFMIDSLEEIERAFRALRLMK